MAGPCEVWLLRQWPQWVSRFAPGPNSFELPLRCRVGRLGRVFTNSRFAECRTDASSYLHLCTNRRNLSYELKLLAACKSLVARRALSLLGSRARLTEFERVYGETHSSDDLCCVHRNPPGARGRLVWASEVHKSIPQSRQGSWSGQGGTRLRAALRPPFGTCCEC